MYSLTTSDHFIPDTLGALFLVTFHAYLKLTSLSRPSVSMVLKGSNRYSKGEADYFKFWEEAVGVP